MPDYELSEMTSDDHEFVYDLIKENLAPELTVTVLKLKPFEGFFKIYFENDLKTYIIKVNKKRVGFVHITKNGEIGYYLLKEYRNKGIAIDAVRDMIKLHPMERYFATVNIKNERSNNLVKKLGFQPKGMIYEKINKM